MISLKTLASIVGLILSAYAVWVEHKMEHKSPEDEFSALCDIEALNASCSEVFRLPQGRLVSYFGVVPEGHVLDLPNAALGVIYYIFQLLLSGISSPLTKLMTTMAFASTVFLAYQLTFVVFELCVLCWSTHVINTFLFYKTVLKEGLRKQSSGGGPKIKQV